MNVIKMKRILAIAAVVAMLVPSAAFAASSSDESYGGPNNVVQGLEQGGGNGPNTPSGPSASPSKSGSLPFTGADLGVLATAGGLLLAMGFGLRRLTHRPSEA